MVKHIVIWKLKDELSAEEKIVAKNNIKSMLESLNGKIEGLINLVVGFNYKQGFDLCLVADYEDRDALEFYQEHPEHLKCKEYIHTVICDRVSCDYEC